MKETKDYILFESFKLFLANGYDKVSMNDLVKASGLSKGAFYHYFNSKEELFKEAISTFFFTGLESERFTPNPNLSLKENLFNLVDFKADLFKQLLVFTGLQELETGYFTLIFQAIRIFPEFREKLTLEGSHEETMLKEIFDIAKAKNELRDELDTVNLAQHYANLLDGMELHSVVERNTNLLHQKQKEATIFFCKMVCKQNGI
jgi:AcrR family transcriptional regulator